MKNYMHILAVMFLGIFGLVETMELKKISNDPIKSSWNVDPGTTLPEDLAIFMSEKAFNAFKQKKHDLKKENAALKGQLQQLNDTLVQQETLRKAVSEGLSFLQDEQAWLDENKEAPHSISLENKIEIAHVANIAAKITDDMRTKAISELQNELPKKVAKINALKQEITNTKESLSPAFLQYQIDRTKAENDYNSIWWQRNAAFIGCALSILICFLQSQYGMSLIEKLPLHHLQSLFQRH